MSGLFHKIAQTARTVRYLKPVQITNRLWRQIKPVSRVVEAPAVSVLPSAPLASFIRRPPSIMGSADFLFLNERRTLAYPEGWNAALASKLWLYNLHYFEGLLCVETPADIKRDVVEQWLQDNPPDHGTGWEPYPLSLRTINWIKWALSGGTLGVEALNSLALQAEYLSRSLEYHLLGNHLFANAKALVFAGCFFEGRRARRWLEKGLKILRQQIPEQFLSDGAHFELSTTYHALLLEDMLDIIHMLRAASVPVPSEWEGVAQKGINWLAIMTRPDGLPPLFNDAAYGITPTFAELVEYAERLGFTGPEAPTVGMHDLPDSGYFRYEGNGYSLFGDIGGIGPDYIPGHGHCDMLNFEFFAHGKPVVVDTGTSTYEANALRLKERGTAAHNTVQVGILEQSEIWAAFRVGRRARIIDRALLPHSAAGAHNGFKKAAGVVHHRTFSFQPDRITIKDELQGAGQSQGVARLHFHPEIDPELADGGIKAGKVQFSFTGAHDIRLETYEYAPEFNKRVTAKVAVIPFTHTLECHIFP